MAVVTFSREAHSGTQDLARQLAERLGYRYVSRDELTQTITARSGVKREPLSEESEGKSLSWWEHLGEHLTGDKEAYVAALKAVLTELALQDNVVIVGHGAGLFLTDMRSVVRVFVVAPMAERIARLEAEGIPDPVRARRMIDDQDRESADYLRDLFGVDWLDAHQWDLVINTGRADGGAALDMLTTYTESLVRSAGESADLERQRVASRVEQALIGDDLGVDRLEVHVADARLVLAGFALTHGDRERAEAVARALAPGLAMDNQIVVRPPSTA